MLEMFATSYVFFVFFDDVYVFLKNVVNTMSVLL
jgi:hypothetical protein